MSAQSAGEFKLNTDRTIKNVFLFCISMEGLIFLLDLFLNHLKWVPFRPLRKVFNITREDALGNWFASTQSLFIGIVLLLIFIIDRKQNAGKERPKYKQYGWAFVSSFWFYLAIDDATKFHERAGSSARIFEKKMLGGTFLSEYFPSYSWQAVFVPILAVVGLAIFIFLWTELKEMRYRKMIVAAFGCYAVAVGIDFIEGMNLESLSEHVYRHMGKAIEETLEMFGGTLFLTTYLRYLFERQHEFKIQFSD